MDVLIRRQRRAIEKLYTDRFTVNRMVEVTMPWGETRHERQVVYQDQPCRISQRALGTNNQGEPTNEIVYETKLFCSPSLRIQQGDEITVTRTGETRTYTAGEPFLYLTHQEVSLQRRERA